MKVALPISTVRSALTERENLPSYSPQFVQLLADIAVILLESGDQGRTTYFIGVGGCESLARHAAEDLIQTARSRNINIRAVWLPFYSGIANDTGIDSTFAAQLASLVSKDDIVCALSSSGKTISLVRALEVARDQGARTIAITGLGGARLGDAADYWLEIPIIAKEVARVQEVQLVIIHVLQEVIISVSARE